MAYDKFENLALNQGIASGSAWNSGPNVWAGNWLVGDGNGNAKISNAPASAGANYLATEGQDGQAAFFKVAPGRATDIPTFSLYIDAGGGADGFDSWYLPDNGILVSVGDYNYFVLKDAGSGTQVSEPQGLIDNQEYCIQAARTSNPSEREYVGRLYLAANGVRGELLRELTLTIPTARPDNLKRVAIGVRQPELVTLVGVASVPLEPYVTPTGTVTTQSDPNGQRVRFIGTTTGVNSGKYTLSATSGGATINAQDFAVTNNAFDFWTVDVDPGTYTPTLTGTGDGGTVTLTGTRAFTINGATGGGDIPPTQTDTTAPTISAATVASSAPGVVVLTASEPLDAASVPAAAAFTVTGHTVQSVTVQGSAVNLMVTPNFVSGETPRTAAYAQPGTNALRDLAGNLLAAFSGLAVANNVAAPVSTVTGVTINPTTATLAGGATQAFTAAAQGANNPAQTFTWTRFPAVGVVTGNGTANGSYVGPAATNVTQTIEVTATSQQDPNFSAKAVVTIPPATPAGTGFTRSLTRTIKVKPAPQMFEGGAFWNMTNKLKPVGTIDKDETIDVSFDLTEVLADILDTVKKIDFDLTGLTSAGGYFTGSIATVFVTGAVAVGGGKNPSITCRMTTNSVPSRVEDWTVELKIEEQ